MRQSGFLLPFFLFFLVLLTLWSPDFLWKLSGFGALEDPVQGEVEILRGENAHLKSLLTLRDSQFSVRGLPFETTVAHVYSRYPVNFKNELILNKGGNEGVKINSVLVAPAVQASSSSSALFFVGRVSSVLKSKSFAETIFDYRFKDPVHIGSKKISGLLVGGLSPVITLIPKDASVSPGDVVISASPDFPYGLVLGKVKEIRPSSDQLFKEASLELLYDINSLTAMAVQIEK